MSAGTAEFNFIIQLSIPMSQCNGNQHKVICYNSTGGTTCSIIPRQRDIDVIYEFTTSIRCQGMAKSEGGRRQCQRSSPKLIGSTSIRQP